jgi:hypothetical protein
MHKWTSLSLTSASESESYVTTDGQSASLSRNKAPIWGLRTDFYYCQTVVGLLTWGALPDERTGRSFTIAAGPRQRRHCRVRVPWNHTVFQVLKVIGSKDRPSLKFAYQPCCCCWFKKLQLGRWCFQWHKFIRCFVTSFI